MPLRERFLAAAVVMCRAVNLVLAKQGGTEIPPILMSAMRFAIGAIMIVPFTRITQVAFASGMVESHQWVSGLTAGWHGWAAVFYSALISSVMPSGR